MDILAAEFFVEAACVFQSNVRNFLSAMPNTDSELSTFPLSKESKQGAVGHVGYNDDNECDNMEENSDKNKHQSTLTTDDIIATIVPPLPPSPPPHSLIAASEYANCMEIQQQASLMRSQEEDEFFQQTGTTLDSTVDIFNDLFSHLADRLLAPACSDNNERWTDRLVGYWTELGIDQSTINNSLHHLRLTTGNVDDCECVVRLLFQRFAEALTGICLSHPCSTAIFLTAFDELKATRADTNEAVERCRQVEKDLSECRRRITLLTDEADERCRQVEAAAVEKVSQCQQKSNSFIAQIKAELEGERSLWMTERDSLINESRQQADLLTKLQKRFDDEVADSSYWKAQVIQLREDYNLLEDEKSLLLKKLARPRRFNDMDEYDSESSSEEADMSSDGIANDNKSDVDSQQYTVNDLRTQLESQTAVNKILASEIEKLENQITELSSKLEKKVCDSRVNVSSISKEEPTVLREDSGLSLCNDNNNNNNRNKQSNEFPVAKTPTVASDSGISCFDVLYGNDDNMPTCTWYEPGRFQNEFEALEAACYLASESSPKRPATPKSVSNAETQCDDSQVAEKACQATMSQGLEKDYETLRLAISKLESNLAESVFAYNSLRGRYQKQLVRSNQLIELTNQLYAENCRISTSYGSSSSAASSASSTASATPPDRRLHTGRNLTTPSSGTTVRTSNDSGCCCESRLPTSTPTTTLKAKRRSVHEQIYVVVGTPNINQQLVLR